MNAASTILFTCTKEQHPGWEQFVPEHTVGYVLSGENHIYSNRGIRIFKAGMIALVRRNELIKSINVPTSGTPFKAVNIVLTQEHLNHYAEQNQVTVAGRYEGNSLLDLPPSPLLTGYFHSLLPYVAQAGKLHAGLASLITQEAIKLLLGQAHTPDHRVEALLFDFREPHKVDLEAFMNQHYSQNLSAGRFAWLTGRSLAGFKRDFQKTFGTSPQRWLLHKRLEQANFLIAYQRQRPSQVYLEVGFENLSHFSAAFKERFGYNPSSLYR